MKSAYNMKNSFAIIVSACLFLISLVAYANNCGVNCCCSVQDQMLDCCPGTCAVCSGATEDTQCSSGNICEEPARID